ncbi:2-hydroxychromene-2-carboxylate isomerase [Deltaproteobacteria bacterium]|nr:2-hydroxychromene-2-carboxylate isomerase [Deltaproteobacteria bacterium]
MKPRPKLEFFFDFSSPFAYLASTQVGALARRTGADLVLRPLLLGGLFRDIGQVDVPIAGMSEAKRQYVLRDLQRWARWWGVPLAWPAAFPLRTVLPLRVFLQSPTPERMGRIFASAWGRGEDIGDPAVLSALGVSSVELASAGTQREALVLATNTARDCGVFGVPAFRIDETALIWGQDRLDVVERACRGERIE